MPSLERIAAEVKRIGLKTMGDNGGYFQQFEKRFPTRTFDTTKTISVGGTPLWGGDWKDSSSVTSDPAAAGKLVIMRASTANVPGNPPHVPSRPVVAGHFPSAAGVAVVAVDALDEFPESVLAGYKGPSACATGGSAPFYMYISRDVAERRPGTGFGSCRQEITEASVISVQRKA